MMRKYIYKKKEKEMSDTFKQGTPVLFGKDRKSNDEDAGNEPIEWIVLDTH